MPAAFGVATPLNGGDPSRTGRGNFPGLHSVRHDGTLPPLTVPRPNRVGSVPRTSHVSQLASVLLHEGADRLFAAFSLTLQGRQE